MATVAYKKRNRLHTEANVQTDTQTGKTSKRIDDPRAILDVLESNFPLKFHRYPLALIL